MLFMSYITALSRRLVVSNFDFHLYTSARLRMSICSFASRGEFLRQPWRACLRARVCVYRMRGTVGSMLIFCGLVSLVGRNTAVHKPGGNTKQRHEPLLS